MQYFVFSASEKNWNCESFATNQKKSQTNFFLLISKQIYLASLTFRFACYFSFSVCYFFCFLRNTAFNSGQQLLLRFVPVEKIILLTSLIGNGKQSFPKAATICQPQNVSDNIFFSASGKKTERNANYKQKSKKNVRRFF